MVCTLTQFSRSNKHHFAGRASDTHDRFGPFPILRSFSTSRRELSRSQRETTPQGADRLQAMAQHAVPPGRHLPGQGQHNPAEGTDLRKSAGKLSQSDPPPEEKHHQYSEMASKEKLLRKVQVALDSSVGRLGGLCQEIRDELLLSFTNSQERPSQLGYSL